MLRQIKQSTVHSPQSTVGRLRSFILCILAGIISALPLINGKLWLLPWFGYIPLFIALRNKPKLQAFLLSYLAGIIFWWGTIYWLVHVTLAGTIILILYLALYFGFFGLFILTMDYGLWTMDLLFIPSVWVLLEYIRSHLFTGFPWALLGYSQYLNLPVIQIADITGVWGASFLIMMVNVAIKEMIGYRLQATGYRKKLKRFLFLACGLWLAACGYGFFRLSQKIEGDKLRVSVIQGNIPQELKWDKSSRHSIVGEYLGLSRRAMQEKPDLIVWPEAALPCVLEEEPLFFEKVKEFVKETNTPLLLGAVTSRDSLYYNSALLISEKGKLLNQYNKLHLVPFGEYIPLKKILPFLETIVPIGDITPGEEYTIFKIPNSKFQIPNKSQFPISKITNNFSVLICFEDLFPQISREFIKKGTDFLVNITNDAWYKQTAAPYQHLQASVFRAVENRVFLVRSANTGVSGFIAPNGKVISVVKDKFGKNIFISGYNTQQISISKKPFTFYTRYGDIFVLLLLIFTLYTIFRLARFARLAR